MTNDIDICAECEKIIGRKEKTIQCNGLCNRMIHEDCTKLTKDNLKCVKEHMSVHYLCGYCSNHSLSAIKNSFDSIYTLINEINERSIKSEKKFSELSKEIKSDINSINNKLTKNENERDNSKTKKSNDNTVINSNNAKKTPHLSNARQMHGRPSLTRTPSTAHSVGTPTTARTKNVSTAPTAPKASTSATPAPAAASTHQTRANQTNTKTSTKKNGENNEKNKTTKETTKNTHNRFLIKPKQNASIEKTIADIKAKFDPRNVKFSGIKKQKNGSAVIECSDKNECDEMKAKFETEMGDGYEVTNIEALKPKIKIFGMSEKIDDCELIDLIKIQNEFLQDSYIEVIKIVKDIKDDNIYNAIIQTDTNGFEKIMRAGKLGVNWDMCIVKEHFSIMRCHNCCGFDHTKETCTKNATCGYCNGQHISTECDANQFNCVSCINANEKMKLSLDTNHHSWSRKCQILTKRIKNIGERVDYGKNK